MQSNRLVLTYPKWDNDLNLNIDTKTWERVFKICFHTTSDNYIIWLQYKIINRILGCKYLLHKMHITPTPNCNLCELQPETLIHLFCKCTKITHLWKNLTDWIRNRTNHNIAFTSNTIILGYLLNDNIKIPINTIILVTKSYIFWCSRNKKKPNIQDLQLRIKELYNTHKTVAMLNSKQDRFDKNWNIFSQIFDNIN